MSNPHESVLLQVWVSVDQGIAPLVRALNRIPGVLTHTSCQGTLGEGGPHPYPPYVMVTWENGALLRRLRREYTVTIQGKSWGYLHPKGTHWPKIEPQEKGEQR